MLIFVNGKRIPLSQVAKAAGIQERYTRDILRGVRIPSVKIAKLIAPQIGVDWTFFFEESSVQCADLGVA